MKNYLYSIGDLSKTFKISVQTLRFYEKIGLFVPERRNEETGYRYYTWKQLERLRFIIHLRDLGLPLKEIRHQLEVQRGDEYLRFMEQYSELIRKRISSDIELKQQVDQKIKIMRIAQAMPQNKTLYLHFDAQTILKHWEPATNYDEHEHSVVSMLGNHSIKPGIGRVGQFISPDDYETPEGTLRCAGLFATDDMFTPGTVQTAGDALTVLPAGTCAAIFYRRRTEDTLPFVRQLLSDIRRDGYAVHGDIYRTLTCDVGSVDPDEDGYQAYLRIAVDAPPLDGTAF